MQLGKEGNTEPLNKYLITLLYQSRFFFKFLYNKYMNIVFKPDFWYEITVFKFVFMFLKNHNSHFVSKNIIFK